MKQATSDKIFSVEEYIQHELTSERRHEFINGQLFEMAGEKDINNEMAGLIYILFISFFKPRGYQVFNHDVKIAIPGGNKYYYPDVFITKEAKTDLNRYIKYDAELIVEVVSESSQITDYVDKYIDYTKIASLKYYMIVEPETTLITLYEKDENNVWVAHKYTQQEDTVKLDKLGFEFKVKDTYH